MHLLRLPAVVACHDIIKREFNVGDRVMKRPMACENEGGRRVALSWDASAALP